MFLCTKTVVYNALLPEGTAIAAVLQAKKPGRSVLAGIFAVYHNTEALNIMPENMTNISYLPSIFVTIILFYWIYRDTTSHQTT